jgi:hypothetical protein
MLRLKLLRRKQQTLAPGDSRPRRGRIQALTIAAPATIARMVDAAGLIGRPIAMDNAAMESEPKRKRRWFQFSLRTLMIGVTLLALIPCGYVGWQAKIVRGRNDMREQLERRGAIFLQDGVPGLSHPELSPSWLRRLLGDEDIPYIWIPPRERLDVEVDLEEVRRVFPEAFVVTSELPPVG